MAFVDDLCMYLNMYKNASLVLIVFCVYSAHNLYFLSRFKLKLPILRKTYYISEKCSISQAVLRNSQHPRFRLERRIYSEADFVLSH